MLDDAQLEARSSGANVRTTMTTVPPPPKTPPPPAKKRLTIGLTTEQAADLALVAEVWNAIDKAFGQRRSRKWEPSSVMAQFIANGLDLFWDQNAGGRPETEKDRKAFVAAAVKKAAEKQKQQK